MATHSVLPICCSTDFVRRVEDRRSEIPVARNCLGMIIIRASGRLMFEACFRLEDGIHELQICVLGDATMWSHYRRLDLEFPEKLRPPCRWIVQSATWKPRARR
jgi:hypothetical protein